MLSALNSLVGKANLELRGRTISHRLDPRLLASNTRKTIERVQRSSYERRQGIHSLDLLVRFGSSQNEHSNI